MPTPRSINPVFEHHDKDLIFGWTTTGNQLLFDKSGDTAFKRPWGAAAPRHIIINYSTVAEPAGALIGSPAVRGYKQWDELDVENIVADPQGSVLYGAVRSASLVMTRSHTPEIQARLRTLVRTLFEARPQTSVQDEVEEIKDWYADKVSQTLEAEALLYKQHGKNIEFVVVVDHIRRDHSFQLSDLACELDDLYPHWDFGFQYVSIRTAGQLPLDEYSDLINGG